MPEPTNRSTPSTSGSAVFSDYRRSVGETIQNEDRRIGLVDLALAIGGNLAAVGFCFAPWMHYQMRPPDTTEVRYGHDTGFATDGWVLLAAAIVALIAFAIVAVRTDQASPATAGFVTTIVAFLAAGTTWLEIDMVAPAGAEAVRAEWG
ncbi:MAG: hypothetical protein QM589_16730 [Thermomicrobiales bacterium]